jgi:DNA end-binding protein Ku
MNMAQRPYWTGQIRIALVYLPVQVYSALRRSSSISLHEIHRPTGERVHHLNVIEDGTVVERRDIVKGYEVEKGSYVLLEKEEIEEIKLPSSDVLELVQFVDKKSLPATMFKNPFFVLPDGKKAEEIYAVIHQALQETGKVGIGQITLRGKEELCAVLPAEKGLVLETLHYMGEVQDPEEAFDDLEDIKPSGEYVHLATELIEKNSDKLDLARFRNHYIEALRELIEAKREHRPPSSVAPSPKAPKVVNFMEALRHSLEEEDSQAKPKKKKTTHRASSRRRSA